MGAPKLGHVQQYVHHSDHKNDTANDKVLINQYIDRIKKMLKTPQNAKKAAQILEEILKKNK